MIYFLKPTSFNHPNSRFQKNLKPARHRFWRWFCSAKKLCCPHEFPQPFPRNFVFATNRLRLTSAKLNFQK